jgi:hypothetical protein
VGVLNIWKVAMIKNESSMDRGIRLVIAVAAAIAAFVVGATTWAGVLLFVVAAIMVVTAAVGFCPLYRVFGLSTCPVPPSNSSSSRSGSGSAR